MYDELLSRLTQCHAGITRCSSCPMYFEKQEAQDCYKVRCTARDAKQAISDLIAINERQREQMDFLAVQVQRRLTPEDALLRFEEVYAITDGERAEVYAALTRKEADDGSDPQQSH